MCPAINSSSEGSNRTRMLSGDTCKRNLEMGLVLAHKWADLTVFTPDETGSVPNTLVDFCTRGIIALANQFGAYTTISKAQSKHIH